MAARHSTPPKRRSLPTRKPPKARPFVQRIAPDAIVIDQCLREALKRLEQAAEAARRLGGKVYGEIRAAEKRR